VGNSLKSSYTEKLIHTLLQLYRWGDKMVTKMWIWRCELVPEQMSKKGKNEKLIYILDFKSEGGI